jgi:drug/metabolite transporter (DMT)-like permease
MVWPLVSIAVYVALVGVASFIEVPIGRGLSAFQLNFLIRVGSAGAALLAVFVVHGFPRVSLQSSAAGLGIGVMTGVGSLFYCFALKYMRVSLVVTFANLYLVITAVLGIVVLSEAVTPLKVAGFAATLVGVVVLSHSPARYGVNRDEESDAGSLPKRAYAVMASYVVIIGVSAFLEKPALKGLDATELNGLMAIAMVAVASIALGVQGARLPDARKSLQAVGVGAMIGVGSVFYFLGLRGLPVSVAAASSNASIVITVLLATIVLHRPLTMSKSAGIGMTVVGVTFLALSAG